MQATYSIAEVKNLLRTVELDEINILKQVLLEEADCYETTEIQALTKMIEIRIKYLTRTSLSFEYPICWN